MVEEHLLKNGDKIVLSQYYERPQEANPNLFRLKEGQIMWTAEVPKDTPKDNYVNFRVENNHLYANSFFGYWCEIDMNTGEIVSKEFVG